MECLSTSGQMLTSFMGNLFRVQGQTERRRHYQIEAQEEETMCTNPFNGLNQAKRVCIELCIRITCYVLYDVASKKKWFKNRVVTAEE